MQRADYDATIHDFLCATESHVLGDLVRYHGQAVEQRQRNAWLEQVKHLQIVLTAFDDGHVFFDLSIPRMGRRADVVLLLSGFVIVVEYKVWATTYHSPDIDQVVDYALDLKLFHAGSHNLPIAPVLLATEAPDESGPIDWSGDVIAEHILANRFNLQVTLNRIIEAQSELVHEHFWLDAPYKPTPTIVEAAKALYNNHTVEEISRSDSGATIPSKTAKAVSNTIESAKTSKRRLSAVFREYQVQERH